MDLQTDNLIELYEKLNRFAIHYQDDGIQQAYSIIKSELVDKVKHLPRDGSKEGMLMDEGYDRAIKEVLGLLKKNFEL